MIHILLVCNNQQLLFISVPKWLLHNQSHHVIQFITYIYEHLILCCALDQFTTRSLWCVRVVLCHIACLWHNCSYMRANSSCGSQVQLHRFPSNLDLGCFFGSNPSHILPFISALRVYLYDCMILCPLLRVPCFLSRASQAMLPSDLLSVCPIIQCQSFYVYSSSNGSCPVSCQRSSFLIFSGHLMKNYSSGTCSEIRGSCIVDHWWSSKSLP